MVALNYLKLTGDSDHQTLRIDYDLIEAMPVPSDFTSISHVKFRLSDQTDDTAPQDESFFDTTSIVFIAIDIALITSGFFILRPYIRTVLWAKDKRELFLKQQAEAREMNKRDDFK